jgi:hypothetical protein
MLPMEKGRYRAKAVAWQLGEASTGTPQVGVEFAIEDGDHKGERISGYFALSDAAAEYTLEKLRNCGWTGNDITELENDKTMGSKVVELVVEPEDQVKNGKPVIDDESGEVKQRLRIQFVNRAGGLAMKATLTDDKKKLLAAKMRGKLAAIDAKAKRDGNGAAPPASGPKSPEPPPVTDDIPF